MLWKGVEAQGPGVWGCETSYLQLGFLQVPAFARAVPLLSRVFADFHSFCPPLIRVNNGVTIKFRAIQNLCQQKFSIFYLFSSYDSKKG
jgi:hypothetical protein